MVLAAVCGTVRQAMIQVHYAAVVTVLLVDVRDGGLVLCSSKFGLFSHIRGDIY